MCGCSFLTGSCANRLLTLSLHDNYKFPDDSLGQDDSLQFNDGRLFEKCVVVAYASHVLTDFDLQRVEMHVIVSSLLLYSHLFWGSQVSIVRNLANNGWSFSWEYYTRCWVSCRARWNPEANTHLLHQIRSRANFLRNFFESDLHTGSHSCHILHVWVWGGRCGCLFIK